MPRHFDNNRKARFYELTKAGVGSSSPKRRSGGRRRPSAGSVEEA
jgi:hypothetical protein